MTLGLSSFTFGWAVGVPGHEPTPRLDALGLVELAREWGLSLVQIGDNVPLFRMTRAELSALKARANESGVALEVGARGLTSEHLMAYIEVARQLDARLLRFVIDAADYEPSPAVVVALLREALPELEEANVTLGIENHDRFPVRTLRAMVDDIGSERVGICLDTANSLGAGEGVREVLAALAPVAVNLHIKDFAIRRIPSQMGFLIEGRPAGAGLMEWPAVLAQMPKRCRTAVVELWTPPAETLAMTLELERSWARQSVNYLRALPFWNE